MNIKNLLCALVASAVLVVAPLFAANSTALAADPARYSLEVTAPKGLLLYFSAYGGTKQNQVVILRKEVKSSTGVYTAKLPSNFDPSTLRYWCVEVLEPADHLGEGIRECRASYKKIPAPEDGVYRSTLKL